MEGYIGTILLWPVPISPRGLPQGWALCNGQLLNIQQNAALFSLIGTTYGGDGRTNFALPNLVGAIPAGTTQLKPLGQTSLAPDASLAYGKSGPIGLPAHTHTLSGGVTPQTAIQVAVPATTSDANLDTPSDTSVLAKGIAGLDSIKSYSNNGTANTHLKPFQANVPSLQVTGIQCSTTGNAQMTQTVNIGLPNLLHLNFIICVQGLYPDFN